MFWESVAAWSAGGVALAVIGVVGSISDGKPIGEMLTGGIGIIALAAMIGAWRGLSSSGSGASGMGQDSTISQLQKQLRTTINLMAEAERRGDLYTAGQMRAQAAVIESQLRSLGA